MPKFKITTKAGDAPEHHEDPLDFLDLKNATDDAQVALADMAREALPDGKRADFSVIIRDELGAPLYVAEMHFAAKRCIGS